MVDRILISATLNGRVVGQHAAGRIGSIMIGRLDACDIVLQGGSVSRTHAEISFENEHFCIHDLGSANGILVNDEAVNAAKLRDRDVVQVGDFELHVTIPSEEDFSPVADGSSDMTIRDPARD